MFILGLIVVYIIGCLASIAYDYDENNEKLPEDFKNLNKSCVSVSFIWPLRFVFFLITSFIKLILVKN